MTKQWVLPSLIDDDLKLQCSDIHPAIVQVLYNRGITTHKEIQDFLQPDYRLHVHDPFLFDDMDRAIKRIIEAIFENQHITIYGDYDVDGVCASTVLYDVLETLGSDVDVHMNHREKEGYGLHMPAIEELIQRGTRLIITNDLGISNKDEVAFATKMGVDVIITDHHHVPERPEDIPQAFAIIHPMVHADRYPFKYLAGGGTAFKLVQGLLRTHTDSAFVDLRAQCRDEQGRLIHWETFEKWLLDAVCISTIGDCMPLKGENRALVYYGLRVLNKTRRKGLRALMNALRLRSRAQEHATCETIRFYIGPRINAASRMDHAKNAFDLLTTKHDDRAEKLASYLEEKNVERQKITERLFREVCAQLQEDVEKGAKVLVASGANWPLGILGLVAGKILSKFSRPVFLATEMNGLRAGTARSMSEFPLPLVFDKVQHHFSRFGGHTVAGGFALKESTDFATLKAELLLLADQMLKAEDLIQQLRIDTLLEPHDLTWDFWQAVRRLEPFGEGNSKPVFLLAKVQIDDMKKVGKKANHLQLFINKNGRICKTIGFDQGHWFDKLKKDDFVDIAFELDENEWNGRRELQCTIIDIRPSHTPTYDTCIYNP
ncbi:single-stranded-DNA-specific exonuclease RecJ [Candidatus Uhrbacteria bacterium]|nr:single-stranded-DNA-specific exonuclease RecJ [Candidatus Uhrbacteria bacterium]